MKKLFICLSALGMILIGCSKNDAGESDKPNNNGNEQPENPNEPKLPELPALPDPDDVCSVMDDLNFMAYCYENFDVNKDGKVSLVEANAVKKIDIQSKQIKSLKGIERFPNLESLLSCDNPIEELDLRYNLQIVTTSVSSSYDIGTFQGCRNLKKILLPSTLKVIEKHAFLRCSNLTEINLPDNLTSIGESAFSGCSSLTEIIFSDNLTSIGRDAFEYCSNLTKVICHALVPPSINYISGSSTIENLYVPAESIQAYKDSLWARYFKNILPIE